jgi:hypothetical protein
VNKHIFAAIIWNDKSKAFFSIEPFHFTSCFNSIGFVQWSTATGWTTWATTKIVTATVKTAAAEAAAITTWGTKIAAAITAITTAITSAAAEAAAITPWGAKIAAITAIAAITIKAATIVATGTAKWLWCPFGQHGYNTCYDWPALSGANFAHQFSIRMNFVHTGTLQHCCMQKSICCPITGSKSKSLIFVKPFYF